jgi:hypothetical protein
MTDLEGDEVDDGGWCSQSTREDVGDRVVGDHVLCEPVDVDGHGLRGKKERTCDVMSVHRFETMDLHVNPGAYLLDQPALLELVTIRQTAHQRPLLVLIHRLLGLTLRIARTPRSGV